MTAIKTVTFDTAKPEPKDAIAMLQADHAAVGNMFAEYEESRSALRKKALVAEICAALDLHVQIAEEIFYPEVTTSLKDKSLVPQAKREHRGVRDLIAQLQAVEPGGAMYDAKVKALAEYMKDHVRDAHGEMFPQAKASALDMIDIGARMAARRDDLMNKAA